MTGKQPEALRCADVLEKIFELKVEAAELRRLHEVNLDLMAFAQAVTRYAGSTGDDFLCDQGRMVLKKVEEQQ